MTSCMEFDLVREALIASDLTEEKLIAEYCGKLDFLKEQWIDQEGMPSSVTTRARHLFHWLWEERPNRYQPHGNYRLHHVIDVQIKESTSAVGNCLGLTLLYNCLLSRIGIEAEAVYLENAFDRGPHVLTAITVGDSSFDIENIFPDGFDYPGHRDNPSRTIWGNKELVADMYHSAGNELFEKGDLVEALQNYNTAIELNPEYERARLNKMIVLDRIKLMK